MSGSIFEAALLSCISIYVHMTHANRRQISNDKDRYVKLLSTISSMNAIKDNASSQELLDHVVDSIKSSIDCEKASIYFCDSVNNDLFLVSKSLDNLDTGLTLAYGQGIAGKCAATCKVIRVDDASVNKDVFKEVDQVTGFHTKSVLCVPIFKDEEKPLAVIQAVNKKDSGKFNSDDEFYLIHIAKQLHSLLKAHARDYFELSHFGKRLEFDENLERSLLLQYGIDPNFEGKKYRIINRSFKMLSNAALATVKLKNLRNQKFEGSSQLNDEILNYDYSPFDVDNDHLIDLAMQMLLHYDLLLELNLNANLVKKFITKVSIMYNNPAFHNFKHGFGVMHLTFQILKNGGDKYLSPLDIYAMLISAICHDICHPGNNNAFEVASRSDRALMFSDDSVLERFHSATTVRLLNDPEYDICASLSPEDKLYFRKMVISNILATDMFHHFSCVDKLNSLCKTPFDPANVSNKKFLMGSIIHSADIGAQTQCPEVSLRWTECIVAEFSDQVKQELKLGLPPTPFMDGLDNPQKKFKLQAGFINDIVIPLWTALSDLFPNLKNRVQQAAFTRDDFLAKSASSSL